MSTNLPLLGVLQPALQSTQSNENTVIFSSPITSVDGEEGVLEAVDQVLGFATTLLQASEEIGKRLPPSGNTLPLETSDISIAPIPETDIVLAELPLVGELQPLATLEVEASAELPIQPVAAAPTLEVEATDPSTALIKTSGDDLRIPEARGLTSVETPIALNTSSTSSIPSNLSTTRGLESTSLSAQPIGAAAPEIADGEIVEIAARTIAPEAGRAAAAKAREDRPGVVFAERPATGGPLAAPQPAVITPDSQALESSVLAQLGSADVAELFSAQRLRRKGGAVANLSSNFNSVAAGVVPSTTSASFSPNAPVVSVPASLSLPDGQLDGQWGQQFAERVGWVIQAKVPRAQVRLHPEHMGPIEMAIEVDEQVARVQFNAAHPLTRDAIEQSLPKLKEMLQQQGLSLEQADVSTFSDRSGAESTEADQEDAVIGNTDSDAAEREDVADEQSISPVRAKRGLIDTYV
ncbi:MAG: flagellar hook-length control protein FliK [Pseudomonadota bacterium]